MPKGEECQVTSDLAHITHWCCLCQVSGRVVTAGQQRSSKTVTARITARPDTAKSARSKLQVTGVAPPLSSIIVERHHPVSQVSGLVFAPAPPRAKLKRLVFTLSFSSPSVRQPLPSSLTPPSRATARLHPGARPELKQARATCTPSKWLSEH